MARPSQRRALGALFVVLTALFAAIAIASAGAAREHAMLWVVTAASAALAVWMASLALAALRAR